MYALTDRFPVTQDEWGAVKADDKLAIAKLHSTLPGREYFRTMRGAAVKGWLNAIIVAQGKGLLWTTIGALSAMNNDGFSCSAMDAMDGSLRMIDFLIDHPRSHPSVVAYLRKVKAVRGGRV